LFVFNDLTAFSLRAIAGAEPHGLQGLGRAALPQILKNSNRRSPVRQENVDFLAERPSTRELRLR
jgi:hypothetical protein